MAPATAPAPGAANGSLTQRAVAAAGDGSANGNASNGAAKHHKHNGDGLKKPPRRNPIVAFVEDTVAVLLVILVLLNFASAAFIELVAFALFSWWWPQAWYTVRMFGIRWGWLFPVLFVKAADIRVMVTGPSTELLGLPQPPFASQAFHFFGLRRLWEVFDERVPRCLVTMNHLAWADSFLLSTWLHANNAVNGDTCWPIYKMFIYLPLGWIAYVSECPVLGYGRDTDLATLRRSVSGFFKRWFSKFFVFPEGAIFRQSMVEKSHDFARKQGLPLLNHCLLPKTGAFLLCGRLLRQQGMKTIVDITLAYPPDAPFAIDPFELLSLLRRHRQPLRIYFHVRKFDMEDVAWEDESKVTTWLTQRFVEKDAMLSQFYDTRSGPLVDGAREEGSSWRDIAVDLIAWALVQYGFYWGLYQLLMCVQQRWLLLTGK